MQVLDHLNNRVTICVTICFLNSFRSASFNMVKAVSLCLHRATMDVSLVYAGAAIALPAETCSGWGLLSYSALYIHIYYIHIHW